MDLKSIERDLTQALRLVEGWMADGEVPAIERDMVLRKIRDAYDAVMFAEPEADAPHGRGQMPPKAERGQECRPSADEPDAAAPEPEVPYDAEPVSAPDQQKPEVGIARAAEGAVPSEPAGHDGATVSPENAVEAKTAGPEPEPKSESEHVPESEPDSEPGQELKRESEPESAPERGDEEGSLFGEEEILLRRPVRKSIIMSLYDDEPAAERRSEPEPEVRRTDNEAAREAAPVHPAETTAVLGEVLRSDVHTIGDSISHPKDIAASAPVESLRSAISVADRFMLIRDLFDGDERACEETISRLDSFDNLDDCMVYIVENHSWRPSSAGAKLIVELLQRKFQ